MPQPITLSSIAAQAFTLMELAPIASYADDSEQAQDAATHFPSALEGVLEAGDWSFASRVVALPEAVLDGGQVEDPALPHVYALPGDCLMLREVMELRARWRQDQRFLRASVPAPMRIRYTARVDDELAMPAQFRTAVAYRLAMMIGPRWLTTQTKLDRIGREAEVALARALRSDARTASPVAHTASDWIGEALR